MILIQLQFNKLMITKMNKHQLGLDQSVFVKRLQIFEENIWSASLAVMDCINPFKEKIEVKLKKKREKLLVRALESIFLVSMQPSKIYMEKKWQRIQMCTIS